MGCGYQSTFHRLSEVWDPYHMKKHLAMVCVSSDLFVAGPFTSQGRKNQQVWLIKHDRTAELIAIQN